MRPVAHFALPTINRRPAYDDRVSANGDQRVVYVLRHGETEWSATGRHTGSTDVPLTTAGEQQARLTAELAGLEVDETTEELAEWDYGDYEGMTTADIQQRVPNWTVWTHPIPHGETAEHVGKRASHLLDRVTTAMAGGDVILVGHGHFSRVLITRWLDAAASDGVRFGLDPAGTTVLGSEHGERQVLRSNIPPWSV